MIRDEYHLSLQLPRLQLVPDGEEVLGVLLGAVGGRDHEGGARASLRLALVLAGQIAEIED